MTKLAHVANGSICDFPGDAAAFHELPVEDCFTEEYLAQCVQVPDNAQVGWVQQSDGTYAAPTPIAAAKPTVFVPRDFMNLFTVAEQQALFTARQTSWQVDQFITLAMAGSVDVTSAEVITDINDLVPMNLLTAPRAAAILSGTAP